MTGRKLAAALLLPILLTASGCQVAQPEAPPEPDPTPTVQATPVPLASSVPTPSPTPTPDPIAQQVASLSIEEKVGQLLVAGVEGTVPGSDAEYALQTARVGGVILFGSNVENADQLAAFNNALKERNAGNLPLLLCVDEEGGRVSRMPPEVSDLPAPYNYIAAGGSPADLGRVLGAECAAFGFNLDFAPSLDVWSNPDNTVIGTRAFSDNWEKVLYAGLQCTQGITDAGIIPVVKHFPGHGDTLIDSHKALPVVTRTLDELLTRELPPFQAAVSGDSKNGVSPVHAVMVGHILVETLDPDLPASLSPAVVTGLLREQMGFPGVVCTDDLTMGAISQAWGVGQAAVLAVQAGCDLLLVCHGETNLHAARDALLAAVVSDEISQARLDESVYRILSLKAAFGLSDAPTPTPDVTALNDKISAILP